MITLVATDPGEYMKVKDLVNADVISVEDERHVIRSAFFGQAKDGWRWLYISPTSDMKSKKWLHLSGEQEVKVILARPRQIDSDE